MIHRTRMCVIIFVISMLSASVSAHPLHIPNEKINQLFPDAQYDPVNRAAIVQRVLIFLTHYGYLPKFSGHGNPLINFYEVKTVREALKNYQKMFALPETGLIDKKTLYKTKERRCGNKDTKSPVLSISGLRRHRRYVLYNNGDYKLPKKILTYSILNYPNRAMTRHQVHRVIRRAFNMWSRVSNLTFYELRADRRADIRLEFLSLDHGDTIAFDGPLNVLAHAFFPMSGALTGAVHLDNDEEWTDGSNRGQNLFGIVVHELGHTFGLRHSRDPNSIMRPVFQGYRPRLSLARDDILGIQSLYGPPEPNKHLEGEEGDHYHTLPPNERTTPAPTTMVPGAPLVCDTKIDAVLPVRGYEIHVFYEQFFWRVALRETGDGFFSYALKDQPRPFRTYWTALPRNLDHIDAAHERTDNKFMFFRGKRFWVLESNTRRVYGMGPEGRPLQDIGLPRSVEKVDAMFTWGYVPSYENPETYKKKQFIFAGNRFWQFHEAPVYAGYGTVSPERRASTEISAVWDGLPTSIDAAYTHTDGETYFFKDKYYYSFNNRIMSVRDTYRSQLPWLGCFVNKIIHTS